MLLCVPSLGWDGGNAAPAGWAQGAFSVTGVWLSAIKVTEMGKGLKEEAALDRHMIQL